MKIVFATVLLFQVFNSWAQDPKRLFQVIFAENVTVNSKRQLESLDYLNQNDIISVGHTGTLAIVHAYGFPLEFTGDTTFSVSALDKFFRNENRKTRFYFTKPELELLFITSSKQFQKTMSERTGWISDRNHNLEILYPPTKPIDATNGLCIVWRSSKSNSYKVKLANLYSDSLTTFATTTNRINIPKYEMNGLVSDSVALIQISDGDNKYSNETLLKKSLTDDLLPYSCELENATTALCAALTMEMSDEPFLEGAEEYYTLATKLSDNEFFKQMLANFKKRRKPND